MENTTLVIMAAGMGSRFGGLKQIEPVGAGGEIIADYSVFDAVKAGFDKVIFIIKHEIDAVFRETVYNRLSRMIKTEIAYQELDMLPRGYSIPPDRVKPWGTAHAVMCAKDLIDGPFAVINADDFYGKSAFSDIYSYLNKAEKNRDYQYCMAGYSLGNTVTETGYVSRGVCETDQYGFLTKITETTHILKNKDGTITYTEDGQNFYPIAPDTVVSMNAWGFQPDFLDEIEPRFAAFLDRNNANLFKSEYYLPSVVEELLNEKKASVRVLHSKDMWYGFTYKEDKETVKNAIKSLTEQGKYPEKLWH